MKLYFIILMMLSSYLSYSQIANVLDYGAVGDSVTDNKAAIDSAISTGLTVYVPKGVYFLSAATIQLKTDQLLFGEGNVSVLKIKSNTRTVPINNGSVIYNIKMIGSGKSVLGLPYQSGVFVYKAVRWKISNCWFEGFAGVAGANGGGGIVCGAVSPSNSDGGQIISCYFYNNNCGADFTERSEYINITGCTFGSNTVGIGSGSGNMSFNSCTIQANGTNVKLFYGANNGHSIFTGCNINHGVIKNLDCASQTNGYTFSGCNLYNGAISIGTSVGIKFIGCDLVGNFEFNITGNSTVLISSCRFPVTGTNAMRLTVDSTSILTQVNNLDF